MASGSGSGGGKAILVFALTLFLLRIMLIPVVDFGIRSGAVMTAAADIQLPIEDSATLNLVGGWLALPWTNFIVGAEATIPHQLFGCTGGDVPAADVAMFRHALLQSFLRRMVLLTFWLGPLLGAWYVYRSGGAKDLAWGIIAGIGMGIMGSVMIGSLTLVLDFPAHILWSMMGGGGIGWLMLWMLIIPWVWLGWGIAIGAVVSVIPGMSRLVLPFLQKPLAGLFQLCGLKNISQSLATAPLEG